METIGDTSTCFDTFTHAEHVNLQMNSDVADPQPPGPGKTKSGKDSIDAQSHT